MSEPRTARTILLPLLSGLVIGVVGVFFLSGRLLPESSTVAAAAPAPASTAGQAMELDWEQLLPEQEREGPEFEIPLHDYLNEDGPAMKQFGSFATNAELDGKRVRVPGFVVPLDMSRDERVTEFFLVPYFGACIHIPPPPPNQIIHGTVQPGFKLDSIYDPQWLIGTLKVQTKETDIASAAYTLVVESIEPYEEF